MCSMDNEHSIGAKAELFALPCGTKVCDNAVGSVFITDYIIIIEDVGSKISILICIKSGSDCTDVVHAVLVL